MNNTTYFYFYSYLFSLPLFPCLYSLRTYELHYSGSLLLIESIAKLDNLLKIIVVIR